MIKIILSIVLIITISLGANDDFGKIVDSLIKQEIKDILKPPKEIKLVKDMFETTSDFENRVKSAKQRQAKLNQEYQRKVRNIKNKTKNIAIKKALQYTWGKPILKSIKYDADNQYFIANLKFDMKKSFNKKVAIKVPLKNARDFYNNRDNLKPKAIFDYDGRSVTLKDIKIPYKSIDYVAQFTTHNIDDTKVAVNISNDFDTPKLKDTNIIVSNNKISNLDVKNLRDFKALDRLLNKTSQKRADYTKWLFTIGIQQYEYTDNIPYAKRSAIMFKKVMKKKLGVPERNCFTMIDNGATQGKIKTNFKKMLRRVKDGDTIYFYYNGHGIPVANEKFEPYMLSSDSEPDYVADEKFFALKNIYSKLSNSKASKVIAVVDSCFSGVTDGKAILKGVAATRMKSRSVAFDKNKMVVLTAGKSYQYSNGFNNKGYRLFSFYIMQNILEGEQDIGILYRETKKETYQTSIEEYGDGRTQEPTIDGNYKMRL